MSHPQIALSETVVQTEFAIAEQSYESHGSIREQPTPSTWFSNPSVQRQTALPLDSEQYEFARQGVDCSNSSQTKISALMIRRKVVYLLGGKGNV